MSTKEKPSTTVTTAAVTPTSPIEAITLDNGWKITIKNPDGTSNELLLEPQRAPTSATLDDSDMEKASPSSSETAKMPAGPKLRWYLVVQYILNTLLAISIIAIMALTLVKYNSTKHITGAWPTNAVLSPTLLMLAVSVLNVLVDAANLLVQCCGSRAISAMTRIVIAVRKYTGVVTTFLPAFAAGLAAFGKNNTGGKDLWGYSCSSAADAMAAVNGSDMVCMTNSIAWDLQILQIFFQFLSLIVPMYAQYRLEKEAEEALSPEEKIKKAVQEKERRRKEKLDGDAEASMLIDESGKVFAGFAMPAGK